MSHSLDCLRNSDFWKKKFHGAVVALDVDKNGVISSADFDLIVQRYRENGASPEHIKTLQESFEKLYEIWGLTDKNKEITIADFETMFQEKLEKSYAYTDELYSGWFKQVDMDANGWISLKEWEQHYRALGIAVEHAKTSFEAMDANHDGKISMEEFIDYHTEFFFSDEDKLKSSILYGPLE